VMLGGAFLFGDGFGSTISRHQGGWVGGEGEGRSWGKVHTTEGGQTLGTRASLSMFLLGASLL
jgi:hypothetical protein